MNLFLAMEDELLYVDTTRPQESIVVLPGTPITALAIDPALPERLYCGTNGKGLLRSVDAGNTWTRIGEDTIVSRNVLSVAVSPARPDTVFAGTEPSAIYRSDDAGDTWMELTSFQELPSKRSWSFPPKPETHHVRWITPHPLDPDHLFVAVEAGALVQSRDGGKTWQDRIAGGPIDTHTLAIHPDRPEQVLSAAGDGFFESSDSGQRWSQPQDGLPYRYCFGLAIDSTSASLAVMSVAPGPGQGHGGRGRSQAAIVRREGDGRWETVSDGLPDPVGMTLSMIAASSGEAGVFVALNNTGAYMTDDGAHSWRRLDVPWKDGYLDRRPPAIGIVAGMP